jgi:SAM-dependent methyltransferase
VPATSAIRRVRDRLRLRTRFRDPVELKNAAQLRWWLEEWEPVIRAGGHQPGDALELLGEAEAAPDYLGRRWQQARAEVVRVTREADLGDAGFFAGKVVVDIGPGPLGFPDACPARISIGVDPLAGRYAEHGLLLPDSPAVYVSAAGERMPLLTDGADVVLARDSLDYVDDPEAVIREARRILRPGGTLILLFDVDSVPNPDKPQMLTMARIRAGLSGMEIVREHHRDDPFGHVGHSVVVVARAPAS